MHLSIRVPNNSVIRGQNRDDRGVYVFIKAQLRGKHTYAPVLRWRGPGLSSLLNAETPSSETYYSTPACRRRLLRLRPVLFVLMSLLPGGYPRVFLHWALALRVLNSLCSPGLPRLLH